MSLTEPNSEHVPTAMVNPNELKMEGNNATDTESKTINNEVKDESTNNEKKGGHFFALIVVSYNICKILPNFLIEIINYYRSRN